MFCSGVSGAIPGRLVGGRQPPRSGIRIRNIRAQSICSAHLEQLTINQRVQGSSPCAPTNPFKHLWVAADFIPTLRSAVIPTKWLLLFRHNCAWLRVGNSATAVGSTWFEISETCGLNAEPADTKARPCCRSVRSRWRSSERRPAHVPSRPGTRPILAHAIAQNYLFHLNQKDVTGANTSGTRLRIWGSGVRISSGAPDYLKNAAGQLTTNQSCSLGPMCVRVVSAIWEARKREIGTIGPNLRGYRGGLASQCRL